MHCILFGNPAILTIKDPLALRHRITPALPFRRHLFVVFSPSTIDELGVFNGGNRLPPQKKYPFRCRNEHFSSFESLKAAFSSATRPSLL